MKFASVMTDDILNKLAEANTEEEALRIMSENGIGFEETAAFIEYIQSTAGELDEAELDEVSGGGYLHNLFARTAYRIQHKKLFVKTTVDPNKRTITVTNRFGKQVSEVYCY